MMTRCLPYRLKTRLRNGIAAFFDDRRIHEANGDRYPLDPDFHFGQAPQRFVTRKPPTT